jgi:hypothetical protein
MPDDMFDNTSMESILNPPDESGKNAPEVGSANIAPDGKTNEGAVAPAVTAADLQKLNENITSLTDRLTAAEQTNTYLRGRIAQQTEQSSRPAPVEDEQPKPFEYDMEKLSRDMEQNAPQALTEFVRGLIQHEFANVRKDATKVVDQRVGQQEQRRSLNDAYTRDAQGVMSRFGEVVKDPAFVKDADAAIWEIIQARGGKGVSDYQPGDLLSAASRVYGEWALSGKVKPNNGSSLREVRQRPGDNGLGDRGGSGSRNGGPATSIDELFTSPRDRQIAKNVLKLSQEGEPGLTEKAWVASYLKAKEDDADFDR